MVTKLTIRFTTEQFAQLPIPPQDWEKRNTLARIVIIAKFVPISFHEKNVLAVAQAVLLVEDLGEEEVLEVVVLVAAGNNFLYTALIVCNIKDSYFFK